MQKHDAGPVQRFKTGFQHVHRQAVAVVDQSGTYAGGQSAHAIRNGISGEYIFGKPAPRPDAAVAARNLRRCILEIKGICSIASQGCKAGGAGLRGAAAAYPKGTRAADQSARNFFTKGCQSMTTLCFSLLLGSLLGSAGNAEVGPFSGVSVSNITATPLLCRETIFAASGYSLAAFGQGMDRVAGQPQVLTKTGFGLEFARQLPAGRYVLEVRSRCAQWQHRLAVGRGGRQAI